MLEPDHVTSPSENVDVLHSAAAGGKVIRGGVIRVAGFGAAVVLGLVTSAILLRHLGVDEYGRYGTVAALLGIVLALTDGGLTAIGARELAVVEQGERRTRLASTLMVIRLGTTLLGVGLAIGFAWVAYDTQLTIGAALVGFSVVLISLQAMATVPLLVSLRVAPVTGFETARQGLTLLGVAVLTLVGAGLDAFFVLQIPIAAILLALTLVYVRRTIPIAFRADRADAIRIARETVPLALASALIVLYGGAMVIIVSLIADERQTGLFVTSSRVMEVVLGLPGLVIAVALPVMSVASSTNRARLASAIQSMTELGLLLATFVAIVVSAGAPVIVRLIGGPAYADAADILAVQAYTVIGVFYSHLLINTLVSLRYQRLLIITNGVAFALVVVVGIALVEAFGAVGGAYAILIAEVVLGVALTAVLARVARDAVPSLRFVWKVVLCAGAGTAAAAAPWPSNWLQAVAAGVAFGAVALLLRAVPREAFVALGTPLVGESRMRAGLNRLYGGDR
jgi:O-antigen/teichoic acid export membrane protein